MSIQRFRTAVVCYCVYNNPLIVLAFTMNNEHLVLLPPINHINYQNISINYINHINQSMAAINQSCVHIQEPMVYNAVIFHFILLYWIVSLFYHFSWLWCCLGSGAFVAIDIFTIAWKTPDKIRNRIFNYICVA